MITSNEGLLIILVVIAIIIILIVKATKSIGKTKTYASIQRIGNKEVSLKRKK